MKKSLLFLCIIILTACNVSYDNESIDRNNSAQQKATKSQQRKKVDNNMHKKTIKNGITYIDDILIVNKSFALPKSYAPGEIPEAKHAIDQLVAEGNHNGLALVIRSAFRSYETQVNLYNNYVARDGQKKADTYSAKPGHSEHQTGLAFDLGNISGDNDFLESFEDTAEGKWIKEHAHEYGFIIRYPKDKSHITGYQYEPWHLRYVGLEAAGKIYDSGLTLEEYLGLKQ